MIRGAVFDLDGTLVDSNPYWAQAPVAYLSSLGKQAAAGLAETIFPMTMQEASEYMIREYGLTLTPEEFAEGIDATLDHYYRFEIPVKDGVPALLNALRIRGIPCAIATVTPRHLVEAVLKRHDLLSFFSGIITTEDVGIGKQSPDVYLRAADCLGSKVAETLVFEDAVHALKTAKRAGFPTVGVGDAAMMGREAEVQSLSDCYLADFSDLEGLFRFLDR